MNGNQTKGSEIERRRFLETAMAVVGIPPLCCTTTPLPPAGATFAPGKVSVDLTLVPQLRRPGAAFSVVKEDAKINVILIHAGHGQYVAMDRSCTHGGAQCTYNPKRRTLQCTSLNHAEYDLHGTLLHGRTHGDLRTYRTEATASAVTIWLERRG